MHGLAAAMTVAALTTGCSNSDSPTNPTTVAPSFAKGGGGGGGGTAIPTPPPSTLAPTITVTSTLFPGTNVLVSQPVTIEVVATSEAGNRLAPTVTFNGPARLTLVSSAVGNNPHGGGPGSTVNIYTYLPSRDQIGSLEIATFVATSSANAALATPATLSFGTVQEAPSPVSNLTATSAGDHIEARWTASIGGVGTVTYTVQACYRTANLRTQPSQCDVIATTTDTQTLNIPLVNQNPTVAPSAGVANYIAVIVTAVDAAGHEAPPISAVVQ